ncbi:MAG: hypothetical protein JWN04_756, partial [Myxococcaceae bacterium]|nr:hypothetical protein [Myxococcaceae bacterium]
DVSKFLIDYSDGLSADFDEHGLLEPEGLGRSNSMDVDYNCNGKVDPKYSRDVNLDRALDVLVDHDDWASVNFIFRRTWSGGENGPPLQFLNPGLHNDVSTADAQHKVDRPCGALDDGILASTE